MTDQGRDRQGLADLETDIERTREDLAQTVDQLAARLDVKSRVKHRLTDDRGKPSTAVRAAGVMAVVGLVTAAVIAWGRR